MNIIRFSPRWKEELVATSDEGKLVFELTMGKYHVYFPDKTLWQASVPGWAIDKWELYHEQCSRWCNQNNIPFTVAHNTFVYEEKN